MLFGSSRRILALAVAVAFVFRFTLCLIPIRWNALGIILKEGVDIDLYWLQRQTWHVLVQFWYHGIQRFHLLNRSRISFHFDLNMFHELSESSHLHVRTTGVLESALQSAYASRPRSHGRRCELVENVFILLILIGLEFLQHLSIFE